MRDWPRAFWKRLADPWTDAQRQDDEAVRGEAAERGAATATGTRWALERLRRRRLRLRLFGVLAVVVAAAAFLTVFTSNRFVHGISAAAAASAAPVALFLALRHD